MTGNSPVNLLMIRKNIRKICIRFDGTPDFVARGFAVGVFVGITPTMPFQTALALGLATLCRGSKPAAVLGIWSGNPLTMPLLYAGCYRLGMFLLGRPAAVLSFQQQSFMEFLKSGADLCCAILASGVILGILPALAVYYMTRMLISRLRSMTGEATSRTLDCAAKKS
jgi:uncharacterized protein